MQVSVKDLTGAEVAQIDLSEAVFGVPMRSAVVHQALVWHQANARQGTSSTKTRGQVSGGGRKPWPQKHTGRARAGSTRSPLWRHGGVAFGPHPRDYSQRLPRKMRQLAIRCLLSDKRAQGNLLVLQELKFSQGKTREVVQLLETLDIKGSALLVTDQPEEKVVQAARNLSKVKTLPASLLNVVDLLRYEHLIMTVDAARRAENLWSKVIERKHPPPEEGQPLETAGGQRS